MTHIIKVIGFAGGEPCPIEGQYLESFDFDSHDGLGEGVFTDEVDRAMKFLNAGAALEFWRSQSNIRPLRRDGKPNRPMTATTVEVVRLPEGNS